ncbi:uncharacterized protein TRIADDRAFT_52766 [Trichoplax adhaerens]|uniref:Uncharacterized protein n=1 Tax=Trichoplax adhaerens TaxID=10228 RepID=B3RK98_TRIAD|nr:hypothetical protein TRIADDRAFT_52766 [Trichoplax adhaerens]EDV29164.1 hypothetical protein TRIADDRAFT_52766 [Trichoplax adhaerens]|eukprot:XP_002108366.1 hypothetical protein TRIADDRAFT_52766 [Trichoplax adhaerens]
MAVISIFIYLQLNDKYFTKPKLIRHKKRQKFQKSKRFRRRKARIDHQALPSPSPSYEGQQYHMGDLGKCEYQIIDLSRLDLANYSINLIPKAIKGVEYVSGATISILLFTYVIQEMKTDIGYLSNLVCLDVQFNAISALPDSITLLSDLETFQCHHNKLIVLPVAIGALHSLTLLDLSYNHLEELPQSIGELYNLKQLYLDHNQLRWLPVEIVSGNPLLRRHDEQQIKKLKVSYIMNVSPLFDIAATYVKKNLKLDVNVVLSPKLQDYRLMEMEVCDAFCQMLSLLNKTALLAVAYRL